MIIEFSPIQSRHIPAPDLSVRDGVLFIDGIALSADRSGTQDYVVGQADTKDGPVITVLLPYEMQGCGAPAFCPAPVRVLGDGPVALPQPEEGRDPAQVRA
jgi:hypothetical protein